MDYPNDFNTPAFPAGKTIAFSRSVAVWISVAFFLIISFCGFLILGIHIKKNYPFLISIDPFTDEWSVVTYPNKNKKEIVPQYQIIQEKLVRDFVTAWFTISDDMKTNENRWEDCAEEECFDSERFNPMNIRCALSCNTDGDVYKQFATKVKPEYMARIDQANEKWIIKEMLITPNSVSEQSGKWQIFTTVKSSLTGNFDVLTFITIDRASNMYPVTLGYYVKNFNSYRIVYE